MVAKTNTIPPIVGVSFLFWWLGTKLEMGWLAFLALAHRMNLGIKKSVRKKAMKNPNPALKVKYWKRLILK